VTLTSTPAIEVLRSYKAAPMFRPTLEQLTGVVVGLRKGYSSLSEIATETGLTQDEVLRVVAELGSWLAKSLGGAKYETGNAVDTQAPQLFQYVTPTPPRNRSKKAQAAAQAAPPPARRKRRSRKTEVILIPPGFEPTASHGRDVSNSLAAIVKHNPSADVLTRFLSRTYTVTPQVLSYPIVTVVWLFAKLGRLGTVDTAAETELITQVDEAKRALRQAKTTLTQAKREGRSNPDAAAAKVRLQAHYDDLCNQLESYRLRHISSLIDPTNKERGSSQRVLAGILVEAYDLLEVARLDAIAGIETLVTATAELDELATACAKAAVLDEATLRQVSRKIAAAQTRPQARSVLDRELRFFARNVAARPNYFRPETVGSLTEAQVRKIATRAGLAVDDDAETRSCEHKVRAQLRELGFESDADRLVPIGVRATQAGMDKKFWSILDARRNGDATWVTALEDFFETVSESDIDELAAS
jgi:hypothetical protein